MNKRSPRLRKSPPVLQLAQQIARHGVRVGIEHLIERDRGRAAIAVALGLEMGAQLGLGRLRHLLAQDEAHLLDQMALDHGILLEPAPVRLAQQHRVVDDALDQQRPLLVGRRAAEDLALLPDERIDGRAIDHDGLALPPTGEAPCGEQERAQQHEMDQGLMPQKSPETPNGGTAGHAHSGRCLAHPDFEGCPSPAAAPRGAGGPQRSYPLSAGRELDARGRDAVAIRPAEAVLGPAGWDVLTADPPLDIPVGRGPSNR